ncbi:MAG: GMP synthase [Elusimicrobia bacterium RIFOXYB2_FULL_49_7]|nr:MAG: GMP synthase [Elusimicrobia bacterium RIFOXYB2_FULL_49_7]
MGKMDKIAVLDFGGQYAHLIANRIRRLGVFTEIVSPDAPLSVFDAFRAFIFSGGPHSVNEPERPGFNEAILYIGRPILGICYGHQLICNALGGEVLSGHIREFGKSVLAQTADCPIFKGLGKEETVWMSHGDTVTRLPEGFEIVGSTKDCRSAAVMNRQKGIFGFQFHPEVTHTPSGMTLLDNFLTFAGLKKEWNMSRYLEQVEKNVKEKVGKRDVFLLVSGGVDSTVAFALLNRILGEERVLGLHIDNGLMRLGETADIESYMKAQAFHNLRIADYSDTFLNRLAGVDEPEQKRRIIGDTFIDVQREELERLKLDPEKWILAQGTIYPDTIESGSTRHSAVIKTHHNRVPVIEEMIRQNRIVEPLADLYKDEVRELGETLGLNRELIWRHPFPGPGLGVRTLCAKGTPLHGKASDIDKAAALAQEKGYSLYTLPLRSVGVQGDFRTYAMPAAVEGEKNWDKIGDLSTEITNTVRALNRVVFSLARKGNDRFILHEAYLTRKRLDILRRADDFCTRFLRQCGLYDKIWQMPVVLLPCGYHDLKESLVLRPVSSSEAMTADFTRMSFPLLDELVRELISMPEIAAVFYDVTNKPPGTIEWE